MENKNAFEDMTVSLPEIKGSSTINHNVRVKLGLNCSEYCLMEYIYRMVKKDKEISIAKTYEETGFTEAEQVAMGDALVMKGFLFLEICNPPKITSKFESAFTDMTSEFENKFWTKDGRTAWPGSKAKSLELYKKTRLKYPAETLISQRDEYFRYLECESKYNGFNRAKMAAERWLLPANAYYLTDWKAQADAIVKKWETAQKPVKIAKTEVLTEEDRKAFYEQDSNQ
jgi:hypothetical protein